MKIQKSIDKEDIGRKGLFGADVYFNVNISGIYYIFEPKLAYRAITLS
ncbi:MAG: hypothetical protein JJU02_07885 [Cryomorphaceae bacterium]|nr:hypothetical protein [Cryomorphaceae bacterium]